LDDDESESDNENSVSPSKLASIQEEEEVKFENPTLGNNAPTEEAPASFE
jgi:hypothetical protein